MREKAPPLSNEKAHVVYMDNGKRVPGVTTITGQLNKPALVPWAWNLGIQKIDYRGYTDKKADIGKLTHYSILCHYKGLEPDTDNFSKNEIDATENAMLSFYKWQEEFSTKHKEIGKLETIWVEKPLISNLDHFGGTPDFLGIAPDKRKWLIDYKTGKDIYREAFYQVAGGYTLLVEATGDELVSGVIILNIGRGEDERFKEEVIRREEIKLWQKGFINLVEFYYNDKAIKKLRRL